MKDYVLELARSHEGYNAKLNVMREYLQAYILRMLYAKKFFRATVFLGGTALRFLHGLPRFSEDLDFSLVKKIEMPFVEIIKILKNELSLAGYSVSVKYDDESTVQYALIKFEGLMKEAGISPHYEQLLSIKVDIDTNPPRGAGLETGIVNKYFPLSFLSYDLPSLFSGKIHCVLNRNYTKGRDLFDLGWYLSRWKDISPNFAFLDNALKQTNWQGTYPAKENWRNSLFEVVKNMDWDKVNADVGRFLESSADSTVFSKENLLKLITATQ